MHRRYECRSEWWTAEVFRGLPMREVLRSHDIGTLFAFLASRGWSGTAIGAATGMDPARVREIARGRRRVTSYDVLARIADGLGIERGLMGLAYTDAPSAAGRRINSLANGTGRSAVP